METENLLAKHPSQLQQDAEQFINDNPIIRKAKMVSDPLLRRGIIQCGAELRMKDAITALRVVGFTAEEVATLIGMCDDRIETSMATGVLSYRPGGPRDPNTEK